MQKNKIMPKIFEYFGFIFFFYSNEHEPIHVYVTKNGQEIVFEIILQNGALCKIVRRHSNKACPMDEKDAAIAESFVSAYYKKIVEKWVNFFIYKKRIRSTKITKKL